MPARKPKRSKVKAVQLTPQGQLEEMASRINLKAQTYADKVDPLLQAKTLFNRGEYVRALRLAGRLLVAPEVQARFTWEPWVDHVLANPFAPVKAGEEQAWDRAMALREIYRLARLATVESLEELDRDAAVLEADTYLREPAKMIGHAVFLAAWRTMESDLTYELGEELELRASEWHLSVSELDNGLYRLKTSGRLSNAGQALLTRLIHVRLVERQSASQADKPETCASQGDAAPTAPDGQRPQWDHETSTLSYFGLCVQVPTRATSVRRVVESFVANSWRPYVAFRGPGDVKDAAKAANKLMAKGVRADSPRVTGRLPVVFASQRAENTISWKPQIPEAIS